MYNEHTLDLGVAAMKKQGLEQGRMIELTKDSAATANAIVGTIESGDFWYGDLEMSDLHKLHEVAKELGESVKVYHPTFSEPMTISA